MADTIRPYDPATDLEAAERIWREVGWIEDDDEAKPLAEYYAAANGEVATIDDTPECLVLWHPGAIRYQATDLPLCAVTAVTTSRLGRKRGFATTLTARALRAGAGSGAAVAALGMFEQGFYNRVGFGTGAYNHRATFDPRALDVGHVPYRRPVRLTVDDTADIHGAMLSRRRGHGGVVLTDQAMMRAELVWVEKPFGLGYRDETGRLTHFIYGTAEGEHGPYKIRFIGYETTDQLLELLRLVCELGDQVATVVMDEPAELQIQDLVRGPLRDRDRTRGAATATGMGALAWMQLRLLDLEPAVAARSWPGPEVRCNLRLSDPVGAVLERDTTPESDDDTWRGIDGDWTLTIGAHSSIGAGHEPGLPTLTASAGAFSRCWFGVRPASSLALTDDLDADPSLLAALDEALALPPPVPGWDF